jgi:hypothetical protein
MDITAGKRMGDNTIIPYSIGDETGGRGLIHKMADISTVPYSIGDSVGRYGLSDDGRKRICTMSDVTD